MNNDGYVSPDSIEVGSLLDQLQGNGIPKKEQPPTNLFPLTTETLNDFILKSSETLINQSLTVVNELKDVVRYNPDSKDVAAFASMINSTNSAIETLSKLNQTRLRIQSAEQMKLLEVKSKEKEGDKNREVYITANREEMLKMLNTPQMEAEIMECSSEDV